MADTSSVFSKGSGGSTFEHHVQAAFLATLITQSSVPCIPEAEIHELALQGTRLGYATDDIVILTRTPGGTTPRLLIQAKNNLIISANDGTFQEVMAAFWRDYHNSALFDQSLDKLVIIKSGLNDAERNHVKVLLNWAKHKATSQDFYLEVNRIGAKKERLKVFADVLAKVNGDTALSDEEIWKFLRCVELLDYDFLNTGSVDKANVISLLDLAKSETATSDGLGIWRELLDIVSTYNPDGGSISRASIKLLPIYQHFNLQKLEPAHRALRKLHSNGHAILLPMKNTVAGHRLPREDLKNRITQSCTECQLTVVTGAAGVGKSAVVRDWLTEQRLGDATFVFRADQFNEPHLSNVFTKQGVDTELSELFACLAILPEKTIVIDSAEKLLEGDPDSAFRQLLAYMESAGAGVSVVLTCRRYAVDLIVHKFGISKPNIIDVSFLTDEELGQFVAVAPSLRNLLVNDNLKSLLRSLKYLDLSVSLTKKTNEDLSGVTLSGFKEKLWLHLVENITVREHGMPLKRKRAFLGVAIQRAQHMSLFIEPVDVSEEAVFALENDGIIFSEEGNDGFAPTHDVLEDLALVKFINDHWKAHHSAEQFFTAVGSEPAMRRAFRLWVEDQLAEETQDVFQLIWQAQASQTIANYWLDELLIAVFHSPNSESFFKAFQELLLEKEAAFLWRCVHLIRTACRQSSNWATGGRSVNPNPIGSGWRYALLFISEYFTVLQGGRVLIANLIIEWATNINGVWKELPTEAEQVKDMLLAWVVEMEKGDEFWKLRSNESVAKQLLIVLFTVVQLASDEVRGLLQRASSPKTRDRDYRISGFYEQVVELCLSGLYAAPLCKHLPDDVIQVANNTWKLKSRENNDFYGHSFRSQLSREEEFGIEEHLNHTFPAGIFKSPTLFLLRFSTVKGLQFVVEFVNYCAGCYQKSQRDNDEALENIILTAADGKLTHQFGNSFLWACSLPH